MYSCESGSLLPPSKMMARAYLPGVLPDPSMKGKTSVLLRGRVSIQNLGLLGDMFGLETVRLTHSCPMVLPFQEVSSLTLSLAHAIGPKQRGCLREVFGPICLVSEPRSQEPHPQDMAMSHCDHACKVGHGEASFRIPKVARRKTTPRLTTSIQ
jgi:hypothetical protein